MSIEVADEQTLRVRDEPVARLEQTRAIRWLHWINFPLSAVMIWSGRDTDSAVDRTIDGGVVSCV